MKCPYLICMYIICFTFWFNHGEHFLYDIHDILGQLILCENFFRSISFKDKNTKYSALSAVYHNALSDILCSVVQHITKHKFSRWQCLINDYSKILCLSQSTLNVWPFQLLMSLTSDRLLSIWEGLRLLHKTRFVSTISRLMVCFIIGYWRQTIIDLNEWL